MSEISEYDQRQLNLMLKNLTSFENKKIKLSSLVGSLEFLLSAMEYVEDKWEENFLDAITKLESVNAIEIIKESEGDMPEMSEQKKKELINEAVVSLRSMIEKEIFGE